MIAYNINSVCNLYQTFKLHILNNLLNIYIVNLCNLGKGLVSMSRRIQRHPIIDVQNFDDLQGSGERVVTFYFEGHKICAIAGDTIASALIANGFDVFGLTEKDHPRGLFCAIGKCSACLVEVDGIPNIRACITPVSEGMKVSMQKGRGKPIW